MQVAQIAQPHACTPSSRHSPAHTYHCTTSLPLRLALHQLVGPFCSTSFGALQDVFSNSVLAPAPPPSTPQQQQQQQQQTGFSLTSGRREAHVPGSSDSSALAGAPTSGTAVCSDGSRVRSRRRHSQTPLCRSLVRSLGSSGTGQQGEGETLRWASESLGHRSCLPFPGSALGLRHCCSRSSSSSWNGISEVHSLEVPPAFCSPGADQALLNQLSHSTSSALADEESCRCVGEYLTSHLMCHKKKPASHHVKATNDAASLGGSLSDVCNKSCECW